MAPQPEWFEKDYYKILGVAESSSQKEITSAYRKLARELHPDANPGDAEAEERFKDVSAAYDVLAASLDSDPAAFEGELAHRSAFLAALAERGACDPVSVSMALADYGAAP